jgi:hypothetical protein
MRSQTPNVGNSNGVQAGRGYQASINGSVKVPNGGLIEMGEGPGKERPEKKPLLMGARGDESP